MPSHANKSRAALAEEEYTLTTGKCPDCGLPMRGHPKCEACHALVGPGHDEALSSFHGHELCGHCLIDWQKQNRRTGGKISWERFLQPSPD